jgi:hypothetical protein
MTPPARGPRGGGLRVTLREGRGLLACDSNGLSDPFVKLRLGAIKRKSECIPKTLNPKWHQDLFLPWPAGGGPGQARVLRRFHSLFPHPPPSLEYDGAPLLLEVYDQDVFSKDFMGSAAVEVADLAMDASLEVTVTLTDPQHRIQSPKNTAPASLGTITLSITHVASPATPNSLPDPRQQQSYSSSTGSLAPVNGGGKFAFDNERIVTVDVIEARDLVEELAEQYPAEHHHHHRPITIDPCAP